MKIEWLPRATRSRDSQLTYIGERNPRAAVAMGDAIRDTVGRLALHPHSGRPGRIGGTRELVIPGTPYIVAYRVEATAVVVIQVLHGAQRWPDSL